MPRKKIIPEPPQEFNVSYRCFYDNSDGTQNYSKHYQPMPLADIPRWIESYKFTHPACVSVTCKVWFNGNDAEQAEDAEFSCNPA